MVKFMSNHISLGKKSFSDFVKEATTSEDDKLVKTAGELPDALKEHQFGKKDDAEVENKDDSGEEEEKEANTEEATKEASADDAEVEEEAVEGEDKEAAAEQVTKEAADKDEAEGSGQLDVEPLHQEGDQTAEGEEKKAKSSGKADNSEGESSGQLDVEPLHQEGESTGDKPGSLDTQKETKAEATAKFEKVAKLNSESREFLRSWMVKVYPAAYVEQLLAEH